MCTIATYRFQMVIDDGLTPRNRGLVILIGSAGLVLFNLFVMQACGKHLVLLFPFAGAIAPAGAVLLVTGATVDRLRDTKRGLVAHAMLSLMLVGLVTGFAMNALAG